MLHSRNRQMPELARESPIVVSADRDQLGAPAQLAKRGLNPIAFRDARPRGVHQIAEKDNAGRAQVIEEIQQLLSCARICQWPELPATPLCPAIPKMNIGHQRSPGLWHPKRARGMRLETGQQ
jgi:hypothetical protein